LRLLRATPPAIPASAAPAASSGVFAFDATFETFSPTAAIGPFDEDRLREEERLLLVPFVGRRDVVEPRPFELVRLFDDALVFDEPFLLVDLLDLERERDGLRLEGLVVVWAI
jgi:hypothetical protein